MLGLSQSCGLHQRQSCRIRLGQRQTLSLEQKQALRLDLIQESDERFGLFLNVVHNVWGYQIQPSARCENCDKVLSVSEIVVGFKSDLNDFTTECPRCKHRFQATNLIDVRTGKEHDFWCANQTLERLPGKEVLEVDDFRKQHPEIFFSAIFHFGSLLNAFKRMGIDYRREKFDLASKAKFCLGQIPDRDVSAIFGVTPRAVLQMRNSLNIRRYSGSGSILPANRRLRF